MVVSLNTGNKPPPHPPKFSTYFSKNEIVKSLCRKRIKLAQYRNRKHLLLNLSCDQGYNYHRKNRKNDDELLLERIMPPRRKWKKLGKEKRCKDGYPLNSSEKNFKSLMFTIKKARNENCKDEWFKVLNRTVRKIRIRSLTGTYRIKEPETIPQVKNSKKKMIQIVVGQ